MTLRHYSNSATYTHTLGALESAPDSGTATPEQRPWSGKVARWAIAATMLTSQGTSILAGVPSNIVQVDDSSAQSNEQGFVLAGKPDITTMNDVTRKPNLHELFDFRDASAISSFLQTNPFLSDVLLGAYYSASKWFGNNTPLALEVFSDPDEGYDQLFLLIRTQLPADDAQQRLDALYDDWWLDVIPTVQHTMAIDIEHA